MRCQHKIVHDASELFFVQYAQLAGGLDDADAAAKQVEMLCEAKWRFPVPASIKSAKLNISACSVVWEPKTELRDTISYSIRVSQ